MTDEEQIEAEMEGIASDHGRIDVMVANAGVTARLPATELPLSDWNKVIGINLTRTLAVEWAPHGITVNAVGPALIRTDLTADIKPEFVAALDAVTPLGVEVDAQDVANAVLFLGSHEARKITGHTLPVDGGFLAR